MSVDCVGLDGDSRLVSARWMLRALPGEGPDVPTLPTGGVDTRTAARRAGYRRVDCRASAQRHRSRDVAAETRDLEDDHDPKRAEPDGGGVRRRQLRRASCRAQGLSRLRRRCRVGGQGRYRRFEFVRRRILRSVFGFPPSGRDVDVTVAVERGGGGEIWIRNFGGRGFSSRLAHDGGSTVSERFGPFSVLLGLKAGRGEIEMPVVGWRLGPLPLPPSSWRRNR